MRGEVSTSPPVVGIVLEETVISFVRSFVSISLYLDTLVCENEIQKGAFEFL